VRDAAAKTVRVRCFGIAVGETSSVVEGVEIAAELQAINRITSKRLRPSKRFMGSPRCYE
jgi:hypothetical protein